MWVHLFATIFCVSFFPPKFSFFRSLCHWIIKDFLIILGVWFVCCDSLLLCNSAPCQICAWASHWLTPIDIWKQEDTRQPLQCYNNLAFVNKKSCFCVESHVRDAVHCSHPSAAHCSSCRAWFTFWCLLFLLQHPLRQTSNLLFH